MFSIKKRTLYALFFIALLTTEFFYIPIGGGTARLYHFAALLLIFVLMAKWPYLFRSPVFVTLLIFWLINLVAASLAKSPVDAMKGMLLLTSNIGISIATALILVNGKLDHLSLKRIIFAVTLVSILWALLQLAGYRFTGISLAFTAEQDRQIMLGLSPSFRTEANTFGKFLIIPFLLFLPEYVRGGKNSKLLRFYILLIIGILAAFTRSAIYGLLLTLIFVFLWYLAHGRALMFTRKWAAVGAFTTISLIVFASGMFNVSEYALHKIDTFFAKDEILEGNSSAFRILAMQNTLDAFLANEKTILIGNGWGQIYMDYGGQTWQTGGGDWLATLGYGGVLGGGAYFLLMASALFSAMKMARSKTDQREAWFAEGVMFSILGVFITGQMAGYLIAPEFWMLVGIAIFLSIRPRKRREFVSPAYRT